MKKRRLTTELKALLGYDLIFCTRCNLSFFRDSKRHVAHDAECKEVAPVVESLAEEPIASTS